MSAGSLKEAYSLAHTAQCRLNIAASRPDRNLRFVVGHLMHYESLRLRIVEIEHDISKNERATSVAFKGTGHYKFQSPSSGLRKSPPPPAQVHDDEYLDGDSTDSDDFPEDLLFDDEDEETVCGLGLQRFPSGSGRTPAESHPPPDLVPDNPAEPEEDDDDDPPSPPECDQETLEKYVHGQDGNVNMAKVYNKVRSCSCHGETEAPEFQRMWRIPSDKHGIDSGIKTMKVVAQVA